MTSSSAVDALRAAQNLVVASAEFNTLALNNATSQIRTPGVLQTILSECVKLSREINYQLFSLILVYIYCETEYVRVFSYVSYSICSQCHTHGRTHTHTHVLSPHNTDTNVLCTPCTLRYNCWNDCQDEGHQNQMCSACGVQRKCCRVGYGSGANASLDCAPTDGCTS